MEDRVRRIEVIALAAGAVILLVLFVIAQWR
jgi:hypothetical protein